VVDFLTVAGPLDSEDCHDLMVQYHATCTAVIERYGGHIVQYLGDGLLVYFGHPTAQEDDPRRAVHTGMVLVTAVRDLGNTLAREYGVRLAVRIGIHTGPVIVGTGEGEAASNQLAVGVTPVLAATLQGLAAPETVVISDATAGLVRGYFVCQSLGEHLLPGMATPRTLYQVLGVSGAHGRLDFTPLPQHTPFVGREAELGMLRE
jgi:class 3 adenylate cyclase